MCWSSFSKPELKVAEDNIPVTKIVKIIHNDIRAYYMDVKYSIGKICYLKRELKSELSELFSLNGSYYRITEGFHSYKSSCPIILSKIFLYTTICVGHPTEDSCMVGQYNMICSSSHSLGIMSCVIPKGSKYYENKDGEIVSEVIKPIYCYKIK